MKRMLCLVICSLLVAFSANALALPWRDSKDEFEQRARQERTVDEEELERLLEECSALEEAIELNPTNLANYLHLHEALYALGLYDEACVVEAMAAIAEDPEDPLGYYALWEELQMCGYYEEALKPYFQALGMDADDTEALETLETLRLAEEKYHSGAYEEAAESYALLADDDDLPVAVVMHYIQALIQQSRYEEALEALFEDIGEIGVWNVKPLLFGDIYFDMGDMREAERQYQHFFDESEYSPINRAIAVQRLQALAEYAPPGFEEAFENPRWTGYSKAAIGYFNELEKPSEMFAVMRKDGHNVLCLLHWSNDAEGYVIVWESDTAVYQGDRTPRISVDWHYQGMLELVYVTEEPGEDEPGAQAFMFLCNEETQEWEFEHMEQRYWDSEDEYSYIESLCMEVEEGRLTMLWRKYDDNGSYLDESDIFADMPYDSKAYALKNFDIDRCNADYATLEQQDEYTDVEEY